MTATITAVLAALTSVVNMFWGLFDPFLDMITSNGLILWPVLVAITVSVVGLLVKIVKKFGVKGR